MFESIKIYTLLTFFNRIFTAAQQLSDFNSFCSQNTLTIVIPYSNLKAAELINFKAGACTGSGSSSIIHDYHYNSTSYEAVLEIKIDECGLNQLNSDSNAESGNSFTAVANVTIGAIDDGYNLVFYNALLGAQCGETTEYVVTFTYSEILSGHFVSLDILHPL